MAEKKTKGPKWVVLEWAEGVRDDGTAFEAWIEHSRQDTKRREDALTEAVSDSEGTFKVVASAAWDAFGRSRVRESTLVEKPL